MNIYDFLQDNASLNITINTGQLIEAINYAVSKTKAEFETKTQPEQYLTRNQAAEMLDVGLSTLCRWHKENTCAPLKSEVSAGINFPKSIKF